MGCKKHFFSLLPTTVLCYHKKGAEMATATWSRFFWPGDVLYPVMVWSNWIWQRRRRRRTRPTASYVGVFSGLPFSSRFSLGLTHFGVNKLLWVKCVTRDSRNDTFIDCQSLTFFQEKDWKKLHLYWGRFFLSLSVSSPLSSSRKRNRREIKLNPEWREEKKCSREFVSSSIDGTLNRETRNPKQQANHR